MYIFIVSYLGSLNSLGTDANHSLTSLGYIAGYQFCCYTTRTPFQIHETSLGGSLKLQVNENLSLELALRGYDLPKLQMTAEIVKIE